ncbi:hypothetical protein V8C37DRAFT_171249 [Trichoderma ceciliae]
MTAPSINQIILSNNRERLLVPLLRWTDRHVELLMCPFENWKPARMPKYFGTLKEDLKGKSGSSLVEPFSFPHHNHKDAFHWRES